MTSDGEYTREWLFTVTVRADGWQTVGVSERHGKPKMVWRWRPTRLA